MIHLRKMLKRVGDIRHACLTPTACHTLSKLFSRTGGHSATLTETGSNIFFFSFKIVFHRIKNNERKKNEKKMVSLNQY